MSTSDINYLASDWQMHDPRITDGELQSIGVIPSMYHLRYFTVSTENITVV